MKIIAEHCRQYEIRLKFQAKAHIDRFCVDQYSARAPKVEFSATLEFRLPDRRVSHNAVFKELERLERQKELEPCSSSWHSRQQVELRPWDTTMPAPDRDVQPILWYGLIPSSNGFVVALPPIF
jgi:hypothetical protein